METTTDIAVELPETAINWSPDAPRGGRAVLNRILKENAAVPLFFAQTLITSLRDVGYNHTTSALCEHVDNAIEAGATEIRVFYRQLGMGKRGDYQIDAAVYDNGRGMEPNVLKGATSFGGSMSYNNRAGIGRFGLGMKTAALSISPAMELYSWQERGAIYSMILDVEAIGKERSNAVNVPDPVLNTELRAELAELFIKPMSWPTDQNDQELFATDADDLLDRLGGHGTIVYIPACDRLSSRYVLEKIRQAIGSDITKLNDEIKRYQGEKASRIEPAKPTTSEQRASEVDHLQAKPLDSDLSDAERIEFLRTTGTHQAGAEARSPGQLGIDSVPYSLYASQHEKADTKARRGGAKPVAGAADGCAAGPANDHYPAWSAGRHAEPYLRKRRSSRAALALTSCRQRSRALRSR